MTWQYSCDITKKPEQPSVIMEKERTPQKSSPVSFFLIAGCALAAVLLFIFSTGFFPGKAGSRSREGDNVKVAQLEQRVAALDRKLAEFQQRLTVVEGMDKHVRKINHDIEAFTVYYRDAEKSRNETFALLTRRLDDLQKKAAISPAQTRHSQKSKTPSGPPHAPLKESDKGENSGKPEKKTAIKPKNSDSHVSSVAATAAGNSDSSSLEQAATHGTSRDSAVTTSTGSASRDSAATTSTGNASRDSAATTSTGNASRDSATTTSTGNASRDSAATVSGNSHKSAAPIIAAVTADKETASTRPARVIKKISKKTPPKKRVNRYHKVKSGETLFRIGKRYNLTVTRIMKMNNLTSGAIYIGQRLKVGTTVTR